MRLGDLGCSHCRGKYKANDKTCFGGSHEPHKMVPRDRMTKEDME